MSLLSLIEGRSALDLDFFETQVIQSDCQTQIEDINDDIKIEVELYKNALNSARLAYTKFQQSSKPFFRPSDFFAEMIKSDSHMEKVRLKLVEESEAIKASEESKKKRELKKIGKAVQVETKLKREKETKRVKEGIKELRKKRQDGTKLGENDEEDFDIQLEETLSNTKKRTHIDANGKRSDRPRKKPRSVRDSKFGHPKPKGVTGRRWKENTKDSANNFEGMGGKGDGRIRSGLKSRAQTGRPKAGQSGKPRPAKKR